MDTAAYLARIGLCETEQIQSLALLRRLQSNHILHIPHENLDILEGIPLSLDRESLFEKLVVRRRGGYCFELNAAFAGLLCALGFSVKSYLARFLKGETEIPVRRHRVVVAECEGKRYLLEVGIGQNAPRYPLLLEEGTVQEGGTERYRFHKEPFLGWVLCQEHEGAWRPYFSFTEEEQLEIDFTHPSFFCEKHPSSPFNKDVMVSIKTPTGRKAINGRVYKVFEGDMAVSVEEGISDERLYELLQSEFGITWKKQH